MNRGPINLPFLLLSCKYFIKKVSKELVLFAFGKTFIFWEKTLDWKISTIPGIRNIFLQSKAMKYKAGICYCRKIGLKIYENEEFQSGQKLKITFSIYFATNKIYIISKIIFFSALWKILVSILFLVKNWLDFMFLFQFFAILKMPQTF